MSCKGFTAGIIAGAVMGAALAIAIDPIDDRSHRRMRKTKENMFKAVSGMLDGLMDK